MMNDQVEEIQMLILGPFITISSKNVSIPSDIGVQFIDPSFSQLLGITNGGSTNSFRHFGRHLLPF